MISEWIEEYEKVHPLDSLPAHTGPYRVGGQLSFNLNFQSIVDFQIGVIIGKSKLSL